MPSRVSNIDVNVLNLPLCREMIEVLELIAGIPDDANVWDASSLAQDFLERARSADAGERSRTSTSVSSPALEAGASTSSATPANEGKANPCSD